MFQRAMSLEGAVMKVGSRKSELALIQTNYVIKLLKEKNPNIEVHFVKCIYEICNFPTNNIIFYCK